MWHMFNVGLPGNMLWLVFGMGLIRIVVIVIAVVLVFKLINKNSNNNYRKNDRAIEILKERYAKGEIDEEEYRRKMDILKD
ncbi:SHOCT domain-containing protein [Thermohalobacter berrensis]|uniref:SHOCT domain-containing protein n=1 Tax=Thermohalobacter berrensis TaxID=99594 RepID=A0A419SZB6_9FIRM|nr:SHOCT domain-containing protein [Thermohalobacter berrensis]RKD30607.1 hypothetical protein BET03_04520 [Thermohalobacter berrensis]